MSAEGDTNLDNDGAADCLALFSERLFKRIMELLNHPHSHEYDDGYISELFALVEVVFALDSRDLVYSCPSPIEILPLISPYQRRWTDYHVAAGHDPPEERRSSMAATFAELERIVQAFADHTSNFVKTEFDTSNPHDSMIQSIFDGLSQ